jgi:hypothetical protein
LIPAVIPVSRSFYCYYGSNHGPQRDHCVDSHIHRASNNFGPINKSKIWIETTAHGESVLHLAVPRPSSHSHELDGLVDIEYAPIPNPEFNVDVSDGGDDYSLDLEVNPQAERLAVPGLVPAKPAETLVRLVSIMAAFSLECCDSYPVSYMCDRQSTLAWAKPRLSGVQLISCNGTPLRALEFEQRMVGTVVRLRICIM